MRGVGSIVARNSFFGIAGQVALKLLSFVFTIAIVRQLGENRFGQYATVVAFVGIFSIFADLGMAGYAIREIARDRSRGAQLFTNMIVLRLMLSIGVLLANIMLALILGYEPQVVRWIGLASIGLLLYSFHGPLAVVLQGLERIDYSVSYDVLNQIVFIAVGALLLWQGWGVTGVIVASFCGVILTSILSWRTLRRLIELPVQIEPRAWPNLLRAGLPFGIITFASLLSFKVDTVLLSLWRTPAEVGQYNVAYNLIFALLTLSSGLNTALVPSLSRQYSIDPTGVGQFYMRTVRLLWTLALPIAIGTTLLANRIIALLYGIEYAPASLALRILIWVLPVLTLTSLCGSITTVLHREHATARINITNAAFNIALNIWAISHYGLIGAAVVTVATEAVGLIQYMLLLRDEFSLQIIARTFRSPLLAALSMGGVVLLSWRLPLVSIVVISACSYGICLIVSGGLKIAELKLLLITVTAGIIRQRAASTE